MKEILEKIIGFGVYAPSGDNSQPWRFKIKDNKIYSYNRPDRDIPFYNYAQGGSYLAHGALIENMKIAAESMGYGVGIELFPGEENLVSILSLSSGEVKNDGLVDHIKTRTTNRRPYMTKPLTDEQKKILNDSILQVGRGRIIIAEGAGDKKEIGDASSVNEMTVLTNKDLHDIFFEHVVWTKKEEHQKKTGLYLKTLEMAPPENAGFFLAQYWPVMKFFNLLGMHKMIAKNNARTYAKNSAFVAMVMPSNKSEDFVNAGRLAQRVWLKAEKMGMSAHPVTGVLFLVQRILAGEPGKLSEIEVKRISASYERIKRALKVTDENILMLLRVGGGKKPSARSSKMDPEMVFE